MAGWCRPGTRRGTSSSGWDGSLVGIFSVARWNPSAATSEHVVYRIKVVPTPTVRGNFIGGPHCPSRKAKALAPVPVNVAPLRVNAVTPVFVIVSVLNVWKASLTRIVVPETGLASATGTHSSAPESIRRAGVLMNGGLFHPPPSTLCRISAESSDQKLQPM